MTFMTNNMRAYELVVKLALPSWSDMGDVTRTLNQNGHHRTHSDINVTNCGRRGTFLNPFTFMAAKVSNAIVVEPSSNGFRSVGGQVTFARDVSGGTERCEAVCEVSPLLSEG